MSDTELSNIEPAAPTETQIDEPTVDEGESYAPEAAPEPAPAPKKRRYSKPFVQTEAQKEALKKAQAARRAKGEASRAEKAQTKARAQQAKKLITAQERLTNEVAPLLQLMDPFLEVTRQQREEIEHLRQLSRRRGGGRGKASRGARYTPYDIEDNSADDATDSEDDVAARQVVRPSQRRASKSKPEQSRPAAPAPPAAAAPEDFGPIQKPPPPQAAPSVPSPAQAAAASLARFMNDLGY